MIHGLAITPPILGRISIGKTIEKNGKRLPQKDDQFTITTQLQSNKGWVIHPFDALLRQASNHQHQKLRSIPIRLLFNAPDLNLRAQYSLFDRQTGRPVCVGNGETCQRRTAKGVEQHPCPTPDNCPMGKQQQCKPYGRLYVSIEPDTAQGDSDGTRDELAAFILRTTGFNSIRTLMARLSYLQAVSGNLLAYLPLQLTLRGKSTTQSYRQPVYFVDLTLRDGMSLATAIAQAKQRQVQQQEQGISQEALDNAARQGFAQSVFEVNSDEGMAVVEEFYPSQQTTTSTDTVTDSIAVHQLTSQLQQSVQPVTV